VRECAGVAEETLVRGSGVAGCGRRSAHIPSRYASAPRPSIRIERRDRPPQR
jgi:hypothetical protein